MPVVRGTDRGATSVLRATGDPRPAGGQRHHAEPGAQRQDLREGRGRRRLGRARLGQRTAASPHRPDHRRPQLPLRRLRARRRGDDPRRRLHGHRRAARHPVHRRLRRLVHGLGEPRRRGDDLPRLAAAAAVRRRRSSGSSPSFKPKLARIIGPIYAVLFGVVLGAISHVYNASGAASWSGRRHHRRRRPDDVHDLRRCGSSRSPTSSARRSSAPRSASSVFYGISLLLSLFGVTVSYFSSASLWSIALSLLIAGVAAFNLMLDFDLVDRGAQAGAPKYMEWYAGLRHPRHAGLAVPRDPPPALEDPEPLAAHPVEPLRSLGRSGA